MTGDRLLTVEEAQAAVLNGLEPLADTEVLDAELAIGRVLAAPVAAATSLPPWDNSAMDGYALRAADSAGATDAAPVSVPITGEVAAGGLLAGTVAPGTAFRIATGAPLPPGADAVIPVELTTPLDATGVVGSRGREASGPLPARILLHAEVAPGNAVRRAGSDVTLGAGLAVAGDLVTPALVALVAGAGEPRVSVRRRPVVAVMATGDEVRRPGEPLGASGIPDANGPGLRALVRDAGATPLDLGIAADRMEDVEPRLARGLAEADAIVVAGGVSVGPYDVVRLAFDRVGHVALWKVAVQPGKPFAFGHAVVPGRDRPVLLFGLPGNPVSAFVTFELFVRPALRRLAGLARLHRPADRAVLLDPVRKSAGRRGYQRVIALRDAAGSPVRDAEGRVQVRLAGGQGSHVISALAVADALAVVPEPPDHVDAGTEVELRWLDRG